MRANREIIQKLKSAAEKTCRPGEYSLFFAPSRINVIGEHIDYNGGKVLPCAIEVGTYGYLREIEEPVLRLHSLNNPQYHEVPLDERPDPQRGWLNYPLGMLHMLREEGYQTGGLEGVIFGNIPTGSGLSSSSSLEMLIGFAASHFFNRGEIAPVTLALLGKRTENEFIGVASGIMDQFAIAMGKRDHGILLDTSSLQYRYVPLDLKDHVFVVLNTKKPRRLVDSKYNERRGECEQALEILQPLFGIEHLCELQLEQLAEGLDALPSDLLQKRTRHCVTENMRVAEAVQALELGNLETLGMLLNQSHISLRDDYEVTGEHLDAIVEAAWDAGAIGARMTGAGFGGCAIALVQQQRAGEFIRQVDAKYSSKTGIRGEYFLSRSGNGPERLED